MNRTKALGGAGLLITLLALTASLSIAPTRADAVGLPVLITPAQEAQLGAEVWAEVLRTETKSTNAVLNRRVRNVVERLRRANDPSLTWTVQVFESDEVNAFALPGRYIAVYTALLERTTTDAALATVIGHEMAHVTQRHTAKQFSKEIIAAAGLRWLKSKVGDRLPQGSLDQLVQVFGVGGKGVELAFQRSYEFEADRVGMMSMARAGYDPHEAITFWKYMDDLNADQPLTILRTHPSDAARTKALQDALPQALALYRPAA